MHREHEFKCDHPGCNKARRGACLSTVAPRLRACAGLSARVAWWLLVASRFFTSAGVRGKGEADATHAHPLRQAAHVPVRGLREGAGRSGDPKGSGDFLCSRVHPIRRQGLRHRMERLSSFFSSPRSRSPSISTSGRTSACTRGAPPHLPTVIPVSARAAAPCGCL